MRVVFFAGPDALDDALFRYIYARVADRFGDVHVVMVRKGPKKSTSAILRRKIKHLGLFQFLEVASGYPLQRFFQSRDGVALRQRLGDLVRPEREPDLSHVSWVSSVNGDDALTTMSALRPDVIIQAGAGILRRKVFSCARICTLNMHHGIAPLIRGMSSIYWALWEREPAWIGATVHMIDDGIDTGDVLAYAPIRLKDASEGFPSLFVRATEEGVTQLLEVLDRLAKGEVWRLPIPEGRQVYRSTFSGWRMLLLAVRRCVRI